MKDLGWPDGVRFVVDPPTAITYYPDGTHTGGPSVDHDALHARALGITTFQHRVAHELAHHLIGRALDPLGGCPILYAAAHERPMPADAALREWWITTLTYLAWQAEPKRPEDYGAFTALRERGASPLLLAHQLRRSTTWLTDCRTG